MLRLYNVDHFKETVAWARQCPRAVRKTFTRSLRTINRIKRNYKGEVCIGPDFVKHSFSWAVVKDGNCVYNGGMILHGYEETWSVELCPSDLPHWSIHT